MASAPGRIFLHNATQNILPIEVGQYYLRPESTPLLRKDPCPPLQPQQEIWFQPTTDRPLNKTEGSFWFKLQSIECFTKLGGGEQPNGIFRVTAYGIHSPPRHLSNRPEVAASAASEAALRVLRIINNTHHTHKITFCTKLGEDQHAELEARRELKISMQDSSDDRSTLNLMITRLVPPTINLCSFKAQLILSGPSNGATMNLVNDQTKTAVHLSVLAQNELLVPPEIPQAGPPAVPAESMQRLPVPEVDLSMYLPDMQVPFPDFTVEENSALSLLDAPATGASKTKKPRPSLPAPIRKHTQEEGEGAVSLGPKTSRKKTKRRRIQRS